jgi:hypothetical protein
MKNFYRLVPLLFIILFLVSCGGGGGSVPVPTGTATLAWTPPTTNDNGTSIGTSLAGFKVHYGTSSGLYTSTIVISSPTATNYTATLPAGATYYFVVTAYNTSGIESVPSNEASKKI